MKVSVRKRNNLLKSLEKFLGNITLACQECGISRRTFYNWKEAFPEFDNAVMEIQEKNLDMAESVLIQKVREGSTAELLFYLKTKGKHRGYVERSEVDNLVTLNSSIETWADKFRKPQDQKTIKIQSSQKSKKE